MTAHTVNCPSKCIRNYHDGWNSLKFMWNKKEENKGQMWDWCFKCVCEQSRPAQSKGSGGIPSLPGLSQQPQLKRRWVQKKPVGTISQKRLGLLLSSGPALIDSSTNAAGVTFNLLPSSLLNLTFPLNSRVCPPWGFWHLFACTCSVLPCSRSACTRRGWLSFNLAALLTH